MTRAETIEAAAQALVGERTRLSGLLEYEAWPRMQPLYDALQAALALDDDYGEEWVGALKAEFARRYPSDPGAAK